MIKRKASFALVIVLVVLGLLVAIPSAAVAAPAIVEQNWTAPAFEGYDSFYDATVVAYTAGSTAMLEFRVNNDGTSDLTIRGASVTFDWGTCTPTVPATFPFVLNAGTYAIFRFECVVPADATNQTLHQYKAVVEYEGMTGPTIVKRTTWEDDSIDLNLNNDVAVPGSVVLWDVTTTGAQVIPVDKYSVSYLTGGISWVAPYTGPTGDLYAAYEYIDSWTYGNGTNKVFRFATVAANRPIVADSVKVVKRIDSPVSSVTKIDTGWTVDLNTGTVTFTTAPEPYEQIGVFYKNYNSFIASGSIAVISADQESYNTNWRRYMETYNTYWLSFTSGEALRLMGAAQQARMQAEIEYREGNFAEANATMQTALTNINGAIAAEATYQEAISDGIVGLLTGGGTVIDAYGAKLNAEATNITELTDAQVKKLKGEASKATNTGIFYIMLGVFTLLVGIAAVLWGLGQFMGARSPKAQGP